MIHWIQPYAWRANEKTLPIGIIQKVVCMKKAWKLAVIVAVAMLMACSPVVRNSGNALMTDAPIDASPQFTPISPESLPQVVHSLSDRELVGQMVMIGFDGIQAPSEDAIRLMRDYKAGNIILFGWNIVDFEQTKALVDRINTYNPIKALPMLVSTDAEGGLVIRFHWTPSLKSAYSLGKSGSIQATYQQYKRIGEGLRSCGITVNLAPVMDIAKTLDGTFLNQKRRMFGSNATLVGKLCAAAVKGLHDGGTLSFGKHFPGHGNTATDSHIELPVIETTLSSWNSYERKPFEASIKQGLDGMLVGHLSYPNIDANRIASQSPVVIANLLRGKLGFEGIIMSDDMRMQALTKQVRSGEAAVRFVEAGGDLVLIGRYVDMQEDVLNSLYNALQSGRLSRQRCEQSVYRILLAKQKLLTMRP